MTVERRQSPQQASRIDDAARTQAEKPLEPPSVEQVDRFRAAMQQVRDGSGESGFAAAREEQALVPDAAADAAPAAEALADQVVDRAIRRADELGLSSTQAPAEMAAMLQAQAALRDGTIPAPATPQAMNSQTFFDLVERHVRQMAVGDASTADGDGQVLLRMSDDTLPGTDLMLSKGPEGWVLRADVRSRDSYEAILEAGPELARRFAERNMGTLTVESHFNG